MRLVLVGEAQRVQGARSVNRLSPRDLVLASHPARSGWRGPQRLFMRSQLISDLYHDGRVVSERTIDRHIRKIRRKVEAVSPALDLIETMYGVGYRFVGKVIGD